LEHSFGPLDKTVMAELLAQRSVVFSAFHRHPVRSTNEIAFIACRSGAGGLWQPSGYGLQGGKSGSIRSHDVSGIRQPSSFVTSLMFPLFAAIS
jgi:hypothetical protein